MVCSSKSIVITYRRLVFPDSAMSVPILIPNHERVGSTSTMRSRFHGMARCLSRAFNRLRNVMNVESCHSDHENVLGGGRRTLSRWRIHPHVQGQIKFTRRSAIPIRAVTPLSKFRKSDSIPSLKITPFCAICDVTSSDSPGVTVP